jgi:hypothetical protein
VQVGGAKQPDQPVAQVLALQQHEDGDDQNDDGGGQRIDDRGDDPLGNLYRRRLRLVDLHCHRLLFSRDFGFRLRRGGRIELLPQPAHHLVRLAQCKILHRIDLVADRRRVARHLLRQCGYLAADQPADGKDDAQRQDDGKQDGRHTPQVDAPQQVDQRRKQEGQQHGQGDRDQDRAA